MTPNRLRPNQRFTDLLWLKACQLTERRLKPHQRAMSGTLARSNLDTTEVRLIIIKNEILVELICFKCWNNFRQRLNERRTFRYFPVWQDVTDGRFLSFFFFLKTSLPCTPHSPFHPIIRCIAVSTSEERPRLISCSVFSHLYDSLHLTAV